MARSIYIDKLHQIEHDIYVVLKEIFSFLPKCFEPILKGLCLIMAGFGGLIIMGWLVFLLLMPLLFVVVAVLSFMGS